MRFDKRSERSLTILLDEAVPRRADGALALCQDCQRWVWFAGGYCNFLTSQLAGMSETVSRLRSYYRAAIERLAVGDKNEIRTGFRELAANIVREVAFDKGWTLRCQRWTNGRVIVWRLA